MAFIWILPLGFLASNNGKYILQKTTDYKNNSLVS